MKRERTPVRLFVMAAAADTMYQATLEKHLYPLWQQGLLENWQSVQPGANVEEAFADARLIVLLLSADCNANASCQKQMQREGNNGNPWIICTLWLALQQLASGQSDEGHQLYRWVLAHRTSLDLLTEQIDATSGKPCWVNLLAWPHAMFLLATTACARQSLI